MPNNNAPQAVTNAKTAAELWNALYRWAAAVLPKKVNVVQSHQDMASVKGTFICINYAGSWKIAGTNASRMIADRPDLPSPRVYVYIGSVEVREVDGDGEFLMELVEALDNPDTQDILNVAGLSVLKADGPQEIPALQQAQWRKESLLTLQMSWARAYSGSTLTIESVDITQEEIANLVDDDRQVFINERQDVLAAKNTANEFTVAT